MAARVSERPVILSEASESLRPHLAQQTIQTRVEGLSLIHISTIVQVTHSEVNAGYGSRVIELRDGWLTADSANPNLGVEVTAS